MSNASHKTWTAAEIAAAAAGSGKPLEVTAARAFVRAGWTATLGTYFEEQNVLRPPRELDVLACRETEVPGQTDYRLICRTRATVSCKGVAPTQDLVAYSLSATDAVAPPRVMSDHRTDQTGRFAAQTYGRLLDLEAGAARNLIRDLSLAAQPQLVALDVVDDKKERKLLGDRDIFDGVDNAIKGAFYWRGTHYDNERYVDVCVPIVVFLRPWWQVPIDGGALGAPTKATRGYLTCRYPIRDGNPPRVPWTDVTAFAVSRDELPTVVAALDSLHEWLLRAVVMWFGRGAPARRWP